MAESNSEDFFQKLLKTFYEIMKPAINMFSDSQARTELLGSLGLKGTTGDAAPPATGGLEAYINKEDDEVEPFKLASAIADMTSIIMAIEGVIEAVLASDDEEAGEHVAGELVTALLNLLTLDYLRRRYPNFHAVLEMLNTLDKGAVATGGSANFVHDYIGGFFKRIGGAFDTEDSTTSVSDALFMAVSGGLFALEHFLRKAGVTDLIFSANYGFENVISSTTPNADKISNRTFTYALESESEKKDKLFNTVVFVPKEQQGTAFVTELKGTFGDTISIDERNKFEYEITGDGLMRIGNPSEVKEGASNKILLTYIYETPDPKKISLLDKPAIRFAFGTVKLGMLVTPDDVLVKGVLNIHYEFKKGGLTGFPFNFLPDDTADKFPLGIGYSANKGFIVDGDGNIGTGKKSKDTSGAASPGAVARSASAEEEGSGVEKIISTLLNALHKQIPLHKNLGNIVGLDTLTIKVGADSALKNFQLEVSLDFWLKLGSAITITISRLGMTLDINKLDGNGGIMGYDLRPGIKWPTGAGIRVNAGVVIGGGFLYLDPDKGEYFGSLELSFKGLFDLKAVGILNTIMPDGSKGFSLLIIITAEFSAVQLGFGFTLLGVGGLLGVNRRAEVEALRVGLKTNAIKSILFPEDVVGNINRIISDIKQIFPIQQDSFLIGIMGKIGWGTPTLISIELGMILQVPDPKILILGVIKLALPTEETAVVKIQVNFLGVIDFQNQFLYFEARLFDSQLVGFPLTGSLALVVAWGGSSTFGLSVGGFHPDFKDYPVVPTLPGAFRDMARISLQLLSGDNPRLGIEFYFAVTSNTVQFGAKAELLAEGPMGFNIYGMLGLDALFIFDPFSFKVQLEATLALRHNSSILYGIHFAGMLSGPTPWHVEGEVSFGILFATITIGFSTTWGEHESGAVIETEDLKALILGELDKAANWKAVIPEFNNIHVTVRTLREDEEVEMLMHPFGAIAFAQRTLPLNFDIKKYGNRKPLHDNEANFKVSNVKIGGEELGFESKPELFAVGNFQPLSEAEKLSRKSFERLDGGVTISDTGKLKLAQTTLAPSVLNYELDYTYDDNPVAPITIVKFPTKAFTRMVRNAAVSESILSWKYANKSPLNAPVKTKVAEHAYTVASNENMKEFDQNLRAGSYAEVLQSLNNIVKSKPEMADELQIVGIHELV